MPGLFLSQVPAFAVLQIHDRFSNLCAFSVLPQILTWQFLKSLWWLEVQFSLGPLAQYYSLFSSTGPYLLCLDFLLFSFIALIFSTVFCHPILSYFPHDCVCGWVIYFVLARTAWSSLGILSLFLVPVSMVFRTLTSEKARLPPWQLRVPKFLSWNKDPGGSWIAFSNLTLETLQC